jgi:hypothetical protein
MTDDDFSPEKYRLRAAEWLARASRTSDPKGKEEMLRLSAEYDHLADSLAALRGHRERLRH